MGIAMGSGKEYPLSHISKPEVNNELDSIIEKLLKYG
jgi:hypothetical protein